MKFHPRPLMKDYAVSLLANSHVKHYSIILFLPVDSKEKKTGSGGVLYRSSSQLWKTSSFLTLQRVCQDLQASSTCQFWGCIQKTIWIWSHSKDLYILFGFNLVTFQWLVAHPIFTVTRETINPLELPSYLYQLWFKLHVSHMYRETQCA